MNSQRYNGFIPGSALNVVNRILKLMRSFTGNQCNCIMTGVIWSYLLVSDTNRAAALSTYWVLSKCFSPLKVRGILNTTSLHVIWKGFFGKRCEQLSPNCFYGLWKPRNWDEIEGNRLPPFALSALNSYSIFFTFQKQGKNQLSDFDVCSKASLIWMFASVSGR